MKPIPPVQFSYNPIDSDALSKKLTEYASRHHDDLIEDFETNIKSTFKTSYAIALNSGTAALHLGLKALGVGVGDIVLASTFTYVASINPILYLGATPFFIDSHPSDWNLDPTLLEAAIETCLKEGKRPKVILVVHTYGMPPQMVDILRISKRYDIPILEDAAESIGSLYENQFTGTIGKVGIFSFNNNKLITTYGGGVLMTSDPEIASKVTSWANQSRDNLPFYEHREVGYNYRMSPLNAACGLTQLDLIKPRIDERIKHFEFYKKEIGAFLPGAEWQHEAASCFSNRWVSGLVLPQGYDAESVSSQLAKEGIEVRLFWKPMHRQPVFSACPFMENGTSQSLFSRGICLPSGNNLSRAQTSFVVQKLLPILNI